MLELVLDKAADAALRPQCELVARVVHKGGGGGPFEHAIDLMAEGAEQERQVTGQVAALVASLRVLQKLTVTLRWRGDIDHPESVYDGLGVLFGILRTAYPSCDIEAAHLHGGDVGPFVHQQILRVYSKSNNATVVFITTETKRAPLV